MTERISATCQSWIFQHTADGMKFTVAQMPADALMIASVPLLLQLIGRLCCSNIIFEFDCKMLCSAFKRTDTIAIPVIIQAVCQLWHLTCNHISCSAEFRLYAYTLILMIIIIIIISY